MPLFGFLPSSGGTLTGNLSLGRHIHGITTVVAAVASGGAGTTPPAPVVTSGSTDVGGTIAWGTGTSPNTQAQLAITFGVPWSIPGGGGPHIVLEPLNAATQALGLFVSGVSPTGFNVYAAVAPAASQSASTYQFSYIVMG